MTIGGTVEIAHAETVRGEQVGRSDGTPGQRFSLQRRPVVPWTEPSVLEVVELDGPTTGWMPVRDFARSGPDDRHYRLDARSGEIELGPEVRHPGGVTRQYGAVPPPARSCGSTAVPGRRRSPGQRGARCGPGAEVERALRGPGGEPARRSGRCRRRDDAQRPPAGSAGAALQRARGHRRRLRGAGPRHRPRRGAGDLPAGHRDGVGRARLADGDHRRGPGARRSPGRDRRRGPDRLRRPAEPAAGAAAPDQRPPRHPAAGRHPAGRRAAGVPGRHGRRAG